MRVGVIGLGWFGAAFAEKIIGKHSVVGSKTTAEGVAECKDSEIAAVQLLLDPDLKCPHFNRFSDLDFLLLNIPPKRSIDDIESFYAAQMDSIFEALKNVNCSHLTFVSSTGVFGSHQLEVDEDTVPEPDTDSGRALVAAERFAKEHFNGRVSVIRPAGLVGGQRHPARYMAGRNGISGRAHPINLVHRDDLILLAQTILEKELSGRSVFHAVSKEHPSKEDYYTAAAKALKLKSPKFDQDDRSKGKTVSGEKSKGALGITFDYDNPYDMF